MRAVSERVYGKGGILGITCTSDLHSLNTFFSKWS